MTKKLLEDMKNETAGDFEESLQPKAHPEVGIIKDNDDAITKRLKMQVLEERGKLFHEIAYEWEEKKLETHFIKGHKKAITCVDWMPDNKKVVTGSKDCCLIVWDLEKEAKTVLKGEKFGSQSSSGHTNEVRALAVSPNGKLMASGGKDNVVRIWDLTTLKQVHKFVGHRDTITVS